MKKIKLILGIIFAISCLNSCTLLAVGAGAAAGGYACTNTSLCNKFKNKKTDIYENNNTSSTTGNVEEVKVIENNSSENTTVNEY